MGKNNTVLVLRMFWLMMEGGLMKFFGKGTTTRFIEDQEEKRDKLVTFFIKNIHNKYVFGIDVPCGTFTIIPL